jgi:uncharacterized surface protein with fasciclin (FAS1) repeats
MQSHRLLKAFSCLFFLSSALALSQPEQIPIMNIPDIFGSTGSPHINSGSPSLADLLTIQSRASIYYSYARETDYSSLLSDEGGFVTAFVPTNKAVMALARKPHQGPVESEIKISEVEFDKQSKENVKRWVAAHLVSGEVEFPSAHKTSEFSTLLEGKSVSITWAHPVEEGHDSWSGMELENGSRIIDMKKASNGILYIIDGTIEVPE